MRGRKRECRIMVITPSFQVGDEGSIPFIRSRGKRYPVVLVPLLINGIVVASHNLGEEVVGKRARTPS